MPTGFRYEDSRGKAHEASFHVDKAVIGALVSIILVLLMQTGSFIWWASKISTTVDVHDRRLESVESWRSLVTTQNEMLVRLEARFSDQTRRLERLERSVDQMEARAVARKDR
jgi:hypothetical protein